MLFAKKIKKLFPKIIIYGGLLFLILQLSTCYPSVGYPFRMIMRPINQSLYGKKTNTQSPILEETYTPYKDPRPNQTLTINGYKIQKTFVKIYRATGRVVWVDQNDALIKSWYLAAGNTKAEGLYDSVAPIDLSLVFGKTADRENLKTIKFKHSDNMLQVKYSPYSYFNPKDLTEIYVIPTTYAIKRAVKTINRGDIVSVVGYIANWQGTDNLSDVKFESAQYPRESKNYKYLFVTKLILNGYLYE